MKVIDLSIPLYSGMEVYPGDPEVEISVIQAHEQDGWELRHLRMGSHTGTHVDAYSHMHPNKASLDEIPIERFFGEAQVVEIAQKWPSEMGLLFNEEMAIEMLDRILESKPRFVGGNMTEELERALLEREIITYTGLVNLEQIPNQTTCMFYGLPLKIKNGDGSPVRAIAIL